MATLLSTLVPVFGIILLGIFLERIRFMPAQTAACLNYFVYWIGLPALLFTQMARMTPSRLLGELLVGLLASLALSYVLSFLLVSRGLRRKGGEVAVEALLGAFPNSIFMGLPILMLLLPNNETVALVAGLCAVVYNVALVIGDGSLALATSQDGGGRTQALRRLARTLYTNPMLGASVLGAICGLGGFPPPAALLSMTAMLGATASPCALFCMGMILAVQMRSSRGFHEGWFFDQVLVHCMKLLLMPLATYVCLRLFAVDGIALGVGVLLAGMPTGIAAYVIAEKHQTATSVASLGIIVSTGFSVLTIPITIWLLGEHGLF